MSRDYTRRDVLEIGARAVAMAGLGGFGTLLAVKAHAGDAWWIDPDKCINSRLGTAGAETCQSCATECVLTLSAIRAVNEFSKCGRCYVCPAYFDIHSAAGPDGLPSKKLCPRDAIERLPIGWIDPEDPANNFYEYVIDEALCNGCGLCVMGCKEPAGLGSVRLEVNHDVCLDCNRCSISTACPEDAYARLST
ncbi:MAG: ferredoxin [Acidobacteriota bacterium]|nr:ferredoxin [Acidobacteriota bacterium]MDH3524242.1 ferredoxin [Acidobacteriota bacterium]